MEQSATSILMIRPAAFGFDPHTAVSNAFQEPSKHNPQHKALAEFDATVHTLQKEGVGVTVIQDTQQPPKRTLFSPTTGLAHGRTAGFFCTRCAHLPGVWSGGQRLSRHSISISL